MMYLLARKSAALPPATFFVGAIGQTITIPPAPATVLVDGAVIEAIEAESPELQATCTWRVATAADTLAAPAVAEEKE